MMTILDLRTYIEGMPDTTPVVIQTKDGDMYDLEWVDQSEIYLYANEMEDGTIVDTDLGAGYSQHVQLGEEHILLDNDLKVPDTTTTCVVLGG